MVLFIGGIVLISGITMALVAATFIDSGYGSEAVDNAEAAATTGVEDAFLQLIRNSPNISPGSYSVSSGNYSANVTVSAPASGVVTVLSVATANNRTRKVQALFYVNQATGQVTTISWGDIP